MTIKPKNITNRELISDLIRDGFYLDRQRGSHCCYRKGSIVIIIAYHRPGDIVPPWLLSQVIKKAGWTEEDLRRLNLIK
jgi:predicted RNA binding protein YcfA (HicA-like mRNA interferase family)